MMVLVDWRRWTRLLCLLVALFVQSEAITTPDPDLPDGTTTPEADSTSTDATPTGCDQNLDALTDSRSPLITPNFPSNYDSNMNCVIIITAPTDYSVQVSKIAFTFETDTYCLADYVAVYDGGDVSSPLIGQYCGSSFPDTITSSSNTLYMQFISDASFNYPGLNVDYEAIDNSYPNCKLTYKPLAATVTAQTLVTTGGSSYPSNTDEYYLITNSGGTLILQLTAMDVEHSPGCVYDRLIIYDGGCTRFNVLATHCGTKLRRWELTGTEYLIQLHSDSSVNKPGFTISYLLGTASTGVPTTSTTTQGPPLAVEVELLDEVLTNYKPENSPRKDLSLTMNANVDVTLVAINGLDEVEQKLTTTMAFTITWKDDFMKWPILKKSGISKMLMPQDDLWKPDIALVNGVEKITAMGASFMFVVIDNNGTCTWTPYQILNSVCQVDMTNYPYDTQRCDLKFTTWSSSSTDVITTIGANGLAKHGSFVEHSEWTLTDIAQSNETVSGQYIVIFTLTLKRNQAFAIFYMAIPVVMLSTISVFMFALPVSSGEKSGFGITVFLSFVVYVIVTYQKMPENSEDLSLFAMYVLIMTCTSAIGLMIAVLQIRMMTLETSTRPLLLCTRKFSRQVLKLQNGLLGITKQLEEQRYKENQRKASRQNTGDEVDNDTDENVWPEFVSALDFVCFWVFLFFSSATTFYFMIYLAVQ